MAYETLLIEIEDQVGVIKLNRPDALNAFNNQLMDELTAAVDEFEANPDIGCIVITGSSKAFAAGADIKEMQAQTYMTAYCEDFITRNWERVSRCRKPVIAAVAGYALGGGCELAMMCDFILAGENAKFGQPEINLGVMPGAGGTQRLTRFVGKSKAMEMCLTGRFMDAEEAERCGLVSRVVPTDRSFSMTVSASVPTSVEWVDGESGRLNGKTFRLHDVDAPEIGGVGSPLRGAQCAKEVELGFRSRAYMAKLTRGRPVHVTAEYGIDRSILTSGMPPSPVRMRPGACLVFQWPDIIRWSLWRSQASRASLPLAPCNQPRPQTSPSTSDKRLACTACRVQSANLSNLNAALRTYRIALRAFA